MTLPLIAPKFRTSDKGVLNWLSIYVSTYLYLHWMQSKYRLLIRISYINFRGGSLIKIVQCVYHCIKMLVSCVFWLVFFQAPLIRDNCEKKELPEVHHLHHNNTHHPLLSDPAPFFEQIPIELPPPPSTPSESPNSVSRGAPILMYIDCYDSYL